MAHTGCHDSIAKLLSKMHPEAADTETLLESDDGSTDHYSSAEPSQTAEAVSADTLLSGPAADCDSAIQACHTAHT